MLSNEELLGRLVAEEDATVERKAASDYKDVLKCAVSFANSLPRDFIGIIFVGVRNDGTIEPGIGTDSLQKKINDLLAQAFPPLIYESRVINKDGKNVIAVLTPGSRNRPHFAGPSYIRQGSETVAASPAQFAELIAQRDSLAYELLRWKGKRVKLYERDYAGHRIYAGDMTLVDCNQFYVVLEGKSFPLSKIELSWSNSEKIIAINVTEQW